MKIVIIGAGIAGLAIGWRLAQAGAEVTILERSQPGSGATGASAGMIAVTAETLEAQKPEVEFARYSNALWPDFAKEIELQSGCPIGYRQNGALILADDRPALDRLRAHGGGEILDVAETRKLAPLLTGAFAGALWMPEEAQVDPAALASALTVAFHKAGGRLLANEALVWIERRLSPDGHERAAIAHTPFGLYHADAFILAAGAWSSLVEEALAPIRAIKGQMIALEPPTGTALPSQVIWGQGIYAVPRDRRLLIGATVEDVGFDTQPTPEGRNQLMAAGERLFPGLRNWTLADHWAGLRPRAPDGLPLLGATKLEGLWLAGGQYRNGILFAPAVARTVCDQLLDHTAGIAAFDPRRLSP